MTPELFHPIIDRWFQNRFGAPTEPQRLGWPEIVAGRNTLIAAPTGSGKTLAAFLVCIDRLLRQALGGTLRDETQVVYVSPLKALSNDVRRNLEVPLAEIIELAKTELANAPVADDLFAEHVGRELPPIRVRVRSGDTPARERQKMTREPPHILVTTPESLFIMLTATRGREMLRTTRTVIVDEIHALARDKRGSHLSLSLERLAQLCGAPPVRIGLSATVRPIDEIARFLVGGHCIPDSFNGKPQAPASSNSLVPEPQNNDSCGLPLNESHACSIVDVGHVRERDIGIEVPPSELSAVCSHEQWAEIYARLQELIGSHRSTLIFVNTRRLAERVAHNLRQQLGEDSVAAHHGSLSREIRLDAEERLKAGRLKAIVATASLELGIDVGFIDLVCQIGSPRSIATFLQRVGRSGHSIGRVPKGRLFPLTRDELLECLALVRATRAERLDAVEMPVGPLDILAQQVVAAAASDEWREDELYELCRRAWPYRDLTRTQFDSIVAMLSDGFATGRRRGAYLHRDQVNGVIRARRGARIAAVTSGGAIPETGDYRVVTEADHTFVGTVNEDFALESISGDVFILGNSSWRIRYVRAGEVVVNDAQGAPATIPFWLGEAPARTIELSAELSRLREELEQQLESDRGSRIEDRGSTEADDTRHSNLELQSSILNPLSSATTWLMHECGVTEWPARQAVTYVAAQHAAIGLVPTHRRIVFERFFDESGGMQLVIHAPFGGRINRAWGLAMRKRFCRSFDFELQAAATENGIVLSLGPQHSFPIEHLFTMLRPDNGEHLLTQALLAVPMFGTRWRWNVTRALAVLRWSGGKRVPTYLQRFRSDDLLTAVFPAQTACFENRPEDLPIPDHPLVNQTVYDCLHEAMDIDRWLGLLGEIQRGEIEFVPRDTREPSPFSYEILNANPYAFLDDAPLEERRTRALATRRTLTVESVRDLGRLDPEAIAQVRRDAWPVVRDADELHDALLLMGALPAAEGSPWREWFGELVACGRATEVRRAVPTPETAPTEAGMPSLWIAAERWPLVHAALPDAVPHPQVSLPDSIAAPASDADAFVALVRGRLECVGPTTAVRIAADLGLRQSSVEAALEALESEGFVLRGRFTPEATGGSANANEIEWCERRLLARIHRLTLDGLRRQIQPVEVADFMRFLFEHQHLAPANRLDGRRSVVAVVEQLQGFEIPAGAWEQDILPGRIGNYDPGWLDELSLSGQVAWGRLAPPRKDESDRPSRAGLTRVVPISLTFREDMAWLIASEVNGSANGGAVPLRSGARAVLDALAARGALFPSDLQTITGLLPAQLEEALGELAAAGLVTADGFAAIRGIVTRSSVSRFGRRSSSGTRRLARWGRLTTRGAATGGRWSLFARPVAAMRPEERAERWAMQLVRRYGVVFRDLLARETAAPPWRLLAPVLRRLEARGEIRGGRFVAGVAGEQFAASDAVDRLRRIRDESEAKKLPDTFLVLSACDPVNLFGVLTPGPRVPATRRNRVAVRRGRLIASLVAGNVDFYEELGAAVSARLAQELKVSAAHRERYAEISEPVG
jgi:ATP-dependent Lhr-like helicase